ncbi:MotA/TolQ/ExbB proton channel family protein [Bartonella krasnovii]|uniref:Biopolymer transporter ExbB n=1 Tax=Bartonella krasnovii TaxID=2267275 RepID=A0A5B9D3E7_9HYPH|nr:MotA/TolQ/ExbB proton channel family protein [Bartonella krasnovii]QEE12765.1 biopolymer transporter ExbB [Bartonella krasnovii]UNF36875.1 MotA/TolQ/ExbB proton channel family protein [Bartonella krasnovii]UNF38561.1 MotA/TolQ/ExbB proton channel family protein [Bartonella krasnovii]UNF41958.1 MotA/TolQ/ExbB proton channel family protein [Bartonella krasnovii]UNF43611.1 MotA/TolQ/ExbB proton channel family protein [Bartonella krasnovii]
MESETVPLEKSSAILVGHDFSPFSMFMTADWVVKAVIILLLLASLISWTIAFVKIIEVTVAKRRVRHELRLVLNAQTLTRLAASLKESKGAGVFFLKEVLKEVYLSTQEVHFAAFEEVSESSVERANPEKSAQTLEDILFYEENKQYGDVSRDVYVRDVHEGLKERVHSLLSRCLLAATRRIACGNAVLATIGAIAPFVGLFATVWGIMNSFIGIAQSQTTRLDVVAPGIAEALFATAIGLFVAIPAVVMYNSLMRALNAYRSDLGDIAAALERLLSRELDRQKQQKSHKK